MPVNRYDQPAQAQFLNTYVPLPFEELMQAGLEKQKRYDTAAQNLDAALVQAEALKYIPTSIDEQYIKGHVVPTLQNIVDEYSGKDLGDPYVVREISKRMRSDIDRMRVADIQQSYTNWMQDQKNAASLRSRGLYDERLVDPYKGYDTNISGIYTYQTPAKLDYRSVAEQYFNNLRGEFLGVNSETGTYSHGVTDSDIRRSAQEGVGSFLDSAAGKQFVKIYRDRTGDNKTPDNQVAYQYLLDVGDEFKWNQSGFVPGYGKTTKTINPIQYPEFSVPGESLGKDVIDYSKNKKKVSELKTEQAQLDNQIKTSKFQDDRTKYYDQWKAVSREIEQRENMMKQSEEKGSVLFNPEYDRVKNEFADKIRQDLLKDSNIKDALASDKLSSSELDKYINAQVQYYSKKGQLEKNLSGQPILYKNEDGSAKLYNVGDAYTELYGEEMPSKIDFTAGTMSKLERRGKALNKDMSSIPGQKEEYVQGDYSERVGKTRIRTYTALPAVSVNKDELGNIRAVTYDPQTGKAMNSAYASLISNILSNPSTEQVIPAPGTEDKKLKKLAESDQFTIKGGDPGGLQGPYIMLEASVKGSDAKGNKGQYQLLLQNQSQIQAVANKYLEDGDTTNYLKWIYPAISKKVEQETLFGPQGSTGEFEVEVLPGEFVVVVNYEGQYFLFDKATDQQMNQQPFLQPGEVTNFLYSTVEETLKDRQKAAFEAGY